MSKNGDSCTHIYGPVPSRRLGFSLGIDIIPYKTCSLDCIYCQLCRNPNRSVQRKKYFTSAEMLSQIKEALDSDRRIDYITFSGSGEPTLNAGIGKLIREIKKISKVPVAILTNSSLLSRASVRQELLASDLVVPSLDAVTQEIFTKINRPHPSIKVAEIIEGLKIFRLKFKGSIWLEIMLVKGINDSPAHLNKLKKVIEDIKPDKIQLNTVIRPPAEKFAHSLSYVELEKNKKNLGKNCEIIAEFDKASQKTLSANLEESIFSMIRRRPVTLSDISASLGEQKDEVFNHLSSLLRRGRIKLVIHKGLKYYEPV